MPDIRMPDGTIMRGVPETATKQEILARYAKYQASKQPIPQEKGLFSNIAEDLRQRGANLANIQSAVDIGQKLGIEGAYEKIGQEAGAIGDILGQGIISLAKTGYEAIPQSVAKPLEQSLEVFGEGVKETPLGGAMLNVAKATPDVWRTYKQANPRTADLVEATTNIVGFTGLGGKKAAEKGLKKAIERANVLDDIIPTPDQVRGLASIKYKEAASKGGLLKSEFTNKFIDKINTLTPQTDIGKIIGGDSPFTQAVEKINLIKNRPMTLESAQEFDELLGDMIDGFVDKTTGKLDKQGAKLFDVQSRFRNMVENVGADMIDGGKEGFQSLKEGRKLWSTSRKMADIERIISRAEGTNNPATAMKSGFNALYHNPNRIRGYSPAERELIKKAATDSAAADLLRATLGSRLISIIAGSTGNIGGAVAGQAASMAARGAAERVQLNKANRILKEMTKDLSKKNRTGRPINTNQGE